MDLGPFVEFPIPVVEVTQVRAVAGSHLGPRPFVEPIHRKSRASHKVVSYLRYRRRAGRATCTAVFDPEEKLHECQQLIFYDSGNGSANNLVSSLRKDRLRQVNAGTSARGASRDLADHYGSVDVDLVSDRKQDD